MPRPSTGAGHHLTGAGERFVPGFSSRRVTADHLARYSFAAKYVYAKRVLDVACGCGGASAFAIRAGASHVVGVDKSADAIDYARTAHRYPNLRFEVGRLEELDYVDVADVAICLETIEHADDDLRALRKLNQALRPGGVLILSTPNRLITTGIDTRLSDTPRNRFHIREYSLSELLERIAAAKFTVGSDGVFGQRRQPHFTSPALAAIFARLCRPHRTTSPCVSPLGRLDARYFVVVAKKPQMS